MEFKRVDLEGRTRIESGKIWEDKVGYSRAVKKGNVIAVTGTVGNREDGTYPETAGEQTRLALATIDKALKMLNSDKDDVIRTRIYVTDIGLWQEIGAEHASFFNGLKPATTMVEVSGLIDEECLVEIEMDAITDED